MVQSITLAPRTPELDATSGPPDPALPTPRRNEWAPAIDRAIDRIETQATRRLVAENVPRTCSAVGPAGVGSVQSPAPTPMQARLDAFMTRAKGPYQAEGQTMLVPAFFRMNQTGWNERSARDPESQAILAVAAAKAHLPPGAVAFVQSGRASTEQVRNVTQALIDAGHLEKGDGDLVTRIQKTMWRFGVGMDCADYAQRAFLAVHGGTRESLGLKPDIGSEDLQNLGSSGKLAKVSVAAARPGDLFILGSPFRGEPGHCVIVYSNDLATEATLTKIRDRCGAEAAPMLEKGDVVHVYQVDSSWGAGTQGASFGGVRRETWLWNETLGLWGRIEVASGGRFVSLSSPAGHPILGVFRPRSVP